MKWDVIDILLTLFFGLRNFGKTSAMRAIFVFKQSEFKLDFKNAEKKAEKCFVFEVIESELVMLNCLY